MSPPTIFSRPKRGIAGGTGPAQVTREVKTWDELIAALDVAGKTPETPTRILIAKSMTAVRSLDLPEVEGITVEMLPTAILEVGADLEYLFGLTASEQTLRGIRVAITTGGRELDYIAKVPTGYTLSGCVVEDCRVTVDLILATAQRGGILSAVGSFIVGKVTGNRVETGSGTDIVNGLVSFSLIAHNVAANSGDIVVTGSRNVISDNVLFGGAINTSGGSGRNVIADNQSVTNLGIIGSITSHDSDEVYGNSRNVTAPTDITLNAADPTLTPGRCETVRLTLGASASGAIVLADGVKDGQLLKLLCVANSGTATLPNLSTSNVRLSAEWNPGVYNTLTLAWNDSDGAWWELARAENVPGEPVSGMALWLDADDADTFTFGTGTEVATWEDKSGNGYDVAQATASDRPTRATAVQNGRAGVLFDHATQTWLESTALFNDIFSGTDFEVFAVVRPASISTNDSEFNHTILGTNSNRVFSLMVKGADPYYAMALTDEDGLFSPDTVETELEAETDAVLIHLRNESGTMYISRDGEAEASVSAGPPWSGSSDVAYVGRGRAVGGADTFFDGHILELLVYPASLSTGSRSLNRAYLSGKWGTP